MDMDTITLDALKESIEHWERIYTNTRHEGEHCGAHDCALCKLFNNNYFEHLDQGKSCCEGCPVEAYTGVPFCDNTPYHYLRAFKLYSKEFMQVAKEEYEFLKSLLPKDEDT